MARSRKTVAELLDLRAYSHKFAQMICLPEATVDVEVRLDALGSKELPALWFEGRRTGDFAPIYYMVPVSDAGRNGVAVLSSFDDSNSFANAVQYIGLPRALQSWVGWADPAQSGDILISIMRDDASLYDEIIPQEYLKARKSELQRVFRGDKLVATSVVEGYLARVGRYTPEDDARFINELNNLWRICDTTCLTLVGADVYSAGR